MEVKSFIPPAKIITKIGLIQVFLNKNKEITKITTMLQSIFETEIFPPSPQNAVIKMLIPADAIMAITAGCND
ncbi:Uncharacterised protein [Dorea longicatena]|nr:Uncharacterised protein [Dorea longicatena]